MSGIRFSGSPSFLTILRRSLLFPIEKKEYHKILSSLIVLVVPLLIYWFYKKEMLPIETVSLILFFEVFRINRNDNLIFVSNTVLMCGYFYLFESTPWFFIGHQLIYFTTQIFRTQKPSLLFYLHVTFFFLIISNLNNLPIVVGLVFVLYPIFLMFLGTLIRMTPDFSREKNESYRWLLMLIVFFMEAIQI